MALTINNNKSQKNQGFRCKTGYTTSPIKSNRVIGLLNLQMVSGFIVISVNRNITWTV